MGRKALKKVKVLRILEDQPHHSYQGADAGQTVRQAPDSVAKPDEQNNGGGGREMWTKRGKEEVAESEEDQVEALPMDVAQDGGKSPLPKKNSAVHPVAVHHPCRRRILLLLRLKSLRRPE